MKKTWFHPSDEEPKALEAELRKRIPLAAAMDVRVRGFDRRGLALGAPLEPNLNPKGTAFAGSLYSLAVLAGWSMVRLLTQAMQLECDIVIQESTVSYLKPVETALEAFCPLPEIHDWERFATMLQRRGRARITLDASIYLNREAGLRFRGAYVAQRYP